MSKKPIRTRWALRLCFLIGAFWAICIIVLVATLYQNQTNSFVMRPTGESWLVVDIEGMQLGFMFSQLRDEEEIRRSIKSQTPAFNSESKKLLELALDSKINPIEETLTDYISSVSRGNNYIPAYRLWFLKIAKPTSTIPYRSVRTQIELLHTVFIVYWLLLLAPAAGLIFISYWPRIIRHRRRVRGLCISCGYNLTGCLNGVCSECGTAIEQRDV